MVLPVANKPMFKSKHVTNKLYGTDGQSDSVHSTLIQLCSQIFSESTPVSGVLIMTQSTVPSQLLYSNSETASASINFSLIFFAIINPFLSCYNFSNLSISGMFGIFFSSIYNISA